MANRHMNCRCLEYAAQANQVRSSPVMRPLFSVLLTMEGRRVLFDSAVSHTEVYVRSVLKPMRVPVRFVRRKKTRLYKVGSVCLHL